MLVGGDRDTHPWAMVESSDGAILPPVCAEAAEDINTVVVFM